MMTRSSLCSLLSVLSVLAVCAAARADQRLRVQVDQRGDSCSPATRSFGIALRGNAAAPPTELATVPAAVAGAAILTTAR